VSTPRPSANSQHADVTTRIPRLLRVGAALSWRWLLVIAALGVFFYILGYLSLVVIPVAIALLLSALLAPAVAWLVRYRVPRALATALVIIGGLAVVGGVLTFVITEFSNGLPALSVKVSDGVSQISGWLENGPLHLSQQQLHSFLNKLTSAIGADQVGLTSSALTTAATVFEVLAAILLSLFTLIFFLHDGAGIWRFLLHAVPADVRDRVDVAGRRGFASLVSYVRATAAVAVVDAVGIGVGIAIVRVPLAAPLGALVFLSAFVPIVGAVVAGAVAVLVALVANGLIPAVIVLAIVIAVMQLESHVLQPLLLGRAVRLHPLAVVLAIATGVEVGGIVGGLLAVPLLAVLNSGIRSLLHDPPLDPDTVAPLTPAKKGRAVGRGGHETESTDQTEPARSSEPAEASEPVEASEASEASEQN
jgi:predicted PurR-regulated permease PerM